MPTAQQMARKFRERDERRREAEEFHPDCPACRYQARVGEFAKVPSAPSTQARARRRVSMTEREWANGRVL